MIAQIVGFATRTASALQRGPDHTHDCKISDGRKQHNEIKTRQMRPDMTC